MAKLKIKFKDAAIYFLIVGLVAIVFIGGTYLIVDKFSLTTAFIYSLIAYPTLAIIKYLLLTVYWKKKK